jgi:uncharacterized membrane protein
LSLRAHAAAAAGAAALLFALTCVLPRVGLLHATLDTSLFRLYGERPLSGQIPYRDFSLEYTPGALPAFVVPALGPSHRFDEQFKLLEACFGVLAVALVPVVLYGVRASPGRLYLAGALAALGGLALGDVTLIRFDFWPALLTVAALAALVHGRTRLGFASLGLATAAKLYPAVIVPLAYFHVRRARGRTEAVEGVAWWAAAGLVVTLPFAVLGPGGVFNALTYQAGRPLQIESLGGAIVLAVHQLTAYTPTVSFTNGSWAFTRLLGDSLGVVQVLVQAVALVAIWALFARGRAGRAELLTAAAAAVAVFVAFGKVFSPQFLIWLIPLVLLVERRRWPVAAALLVAALLLTRAFYPGRYDELVALEALPTWLLVGRDAAVVALAAVTVLALQRQRVAQEVGGQD